MKELIKNAYHYINIILQTIVSVFSVILFSSYKNSKFIRNFESRKSSCKVLGNGPSLRKEFDYNLDAFKNYENDVFCVNLFCEDPLFTEIKPINYVIADNVFWKDRIDPITIKIQDSFFKIMNEVTWNMNLLIPNDAYNIISKSLNNTFLQVIPYNRTPVHGLRSVAHLLYRKNLGMPRPVNILNATLFLAINMGYDKIYLYGADHSWISDLYVDENNNVCCYQNHFYGEKTSFIMPRGSLSLGLRSIADALDSYKLIKAFAEEKKCMIINRTTKSFVDIFDRED